MTAPEHAVHAPAEHAHHGDLAVAATRGERRTAWVVAITFVTMIAELIAGEITGSLALTADGWHMASHAGAMGLALGAYWFARTRAASSHFTFGTGKVGALGGFASADVEVVAYVAPGVYAGGAGNNFSGACDGNAGTGAGGL